MANGFNPVLVVQRDGNHVEPAPNFPEALPLEVLLRQTPQAALFAARHRRLRRIPFAVSSRFHLDEDQGGAVPCHQIDLSEAGSHVAVQDGESALTEEPRCRLLASFADRPSEVHELPVTV